MYVDSVEQLMQRALLCVVKKQKERESLVQIKVMNFLDLCLALSISNKNFSVLKWNLIHIDHISTG